MNEDMSFTLDRGHDIPVYSKICVFCKHLRVTQGRTCAAFPEINSIPMAIWMGENDHTSPFDGDNGIQFDRSKLAQA